MGTPFKMKGSPMQRNFGIGSPVKQVKKTDPVPTASDTLGAYVHQNYQHPDPKLEESNRKLRGHKVTKAEMLRSSNSYMNELIKKK